MAWEGGCEHVAGRVGFGCAREGSIGSRRAGSPDRITFTDGEELGICRFGGGGHYTKCSDDLTEALGDQKRRLECLLNIPDNCVVHEVNWLALEHQTTTFGLCLTDVTARITPETCMSFTTSQQGI
jgi:hypothetical protein